MKFFSSDFSRYGVFIIGICSLISSCTVYKTAEYFQVHENHVERYNGIFIKYQNGDTNYKKMEKLFGSMSTNDTIRDITEITYKPFNIEGHKAIFPIETKDTAIPNPTIGPLRFLMCTFIFYHDTVLLAPIYNKEDLKFLHFTDFHYKIPPKIRKNDTISVVDGRKKMLLCNFKKSRLKLDNRKFRNCLQFDILDIWPETTHTEKVWLHKKSGLLKWIKTTGRVELRIL